MVCVRTSELFRLRLAPFFLPPPFFFFAAAAAFFLAAAADGLRTTLGLVLRFLPRYTMLIPLISYSLIAPISLITTALYWEHLPYAL